MFEIGIPTLNRADLLLPTLHLYSKDFDGITIHIVDNGNQGLIDFKNIKVHKSEKNLGVAGSWNFLCHKIFKNCDNALILNDDIYCGYNEIVVNNAIDKNKVGITTSTKSWSVLLLNKSFYKKVGKFDEEFYPCYYEDSDYLYRMKLMGYRQHINSSLDPLVFKQSQTYEKNPSLVNKGMHDGRLRYIEKWGGSPLLETFKTPYNQ